MPPTLYVEHLFLIFGVEGRDAQNELVEDCSQRVEVDHLGPVLRQQQQKPVTQRQQEPVVRKQQQKPVLQHEQEPFLRKQQQKPVLQRQQEPVLQRQQQQQQKPVFQPEPVLEPVPDLIDLDSLVALEPEVLDLSAAMGLPLPPHGHGFLTPEREQVRATKVAKNKGSFMRESF